MPGGFFAFLILLILGGTTIKGSTRTIRQGNQALVETLGRYQGRKLDPGFHFLVPILDRVAAQETVRERVLDVPPQKCITRDNVAITVDAVVYWRIVNLEKATYKVQNLHDAMVNLVLTQIRAEVGKLELDQTFTARSEVNEVLLRELDLATDPWGVKVNRVELRDIIPAKAVQESMELQMSAERRKRAAILTSEGEREAAINSARGRAEAQVLEAEANQRALIFKAQAEQKQSILRAQATASALKILTEALQNDSRANEALQFLLAQSYMDMGFKLGASPSSKVMFMDPRTIPATFEGVKSILSGEPSQDTPSNPPSTPVALPSGNVTLDFPSLDLKSLPEIPG